jgi:hypothetical protein
MLPKDAKERRRETDEKAMEQTQVGDHFAIMKPEDKPELYSDEVFKDATIRWLVETDQVSNHLSSSLCLSYDYSAAHRCARTSIISTHDAPCISRNPWHHIIKQKTNARQDHFTVQGPNE